MPPKGDLPTVSEASSKAKELVLTATECVLLLENVFSYYRMCSLTIECVLLLQNVFSYYRVCCGWIVQRE